MSKIFKVIVAVIMVVVAYAILGPAGNFAAQLLPGLAGASAVVQGAALGGVMGFGMTVINGGSLGDALLAGLQGALFGAISAGVAQGIGDWAGKTFFGGNLEAGHAANYFSGGNFAAATAKATLHGLTRGVITAAQGGKFGAGFASGFISSGFAVGKSTFESLKGAAVAARTAVMAVVGGVTSEITGGKFANGAITGAFVHLFNHENISSTLGAVKHYFSGNGEIVELDSQTKQELRNHPLVLKQSSALRNGTAKYMNGNLSVDLTSDTYHVGDTGVVFNTICSEKSCTTTYIGFVQSSQGGNMVTSLDSFSDPIDLGFELPGGTPYSYMPYSWTETYSNKF